MPGAWPFNEPRPSLRRLGYGVPLDADVIFDMRFLPNPYYVPSLKDKTGKNKQVQEYVFKAPEAKDFLDKLEALLDAVVPAFIREGKYNLTICFGCTGGHHRSVAMATAFKARLEATGHHVVLIHRDL